MCPNQQKTADLATFTEEIRNGKLHFLCSDGKQVVVYGFVISIANKLAADGWLQQQNACV